MDHDVEARLAELRAEAVGGALDGEVAEVLVALVLPSLGGRLVEDVVLRVERHDALELELASVGEGERRLHLAASEERLKNAERGRRRRGRATPPSCRVGGASEKCRARAARCRRTRWRLPRRAPWRWRNRSRRRLRLPR